MTLTGLLSQGLSRFRNGASNLLDDRRRQVGHRAFSFSTLGREAVSSVKRHAVLHIMSVMGIDETLERNNDIDLLIFEPALASTREESVRIRSAVGNVGCLMDVIVVSTGRFEATKNIFGGIAWPAHKYGRVLNEAVPQ